jgi:hypothetical protein
MTGQITVTTQEIAAAAASAGWRLVRDVKVPDCRFGLLLRVLVVESNGDFLPNVFDALGIPGVSDEFLETKRELLIRFARRRDSATKSALQRLAKDPRLLKPIKIQCLQMFKLIRNAAIVQPNDDYPRLLFLESLGFSLNRADFSYKS